MGDKMWHQFSCCMDQFRLGHSYCIIIKTFEKSEYGKYYWMPTNSVLFSDNLHWDHVCFLTDCWNAALSKFHPLSQRRSFLLHCLSWAETAMLACFFIVNGSLPLAEISKLMTTSSCLFPHPHSTVLNCVNMPRFIDLFYYWWIFGVFPLTMNL